MPDSEKNVQIDIPILTGSYFDLSKFDFSFKDIYLIEIESVDFEEYINRCSNPENDGYNYQMVQSIIKDKLGEFDKKYAIIKRNPFTEYNYSEIITVWKLLLIIHPSDLQIEHELHFLVDEGFLSTAGYSTWNDHNIGGYPEKRLFNKDEYLDEINGYIKLVFDRMQRTDYIGLCIYHYITSYSASHFHYRFTSLFTALDCIIKNETELQYRLKRAIAIICGDDEYTGSIIFKKVAILCKLRNDIVHGNRYSMADVHEKLPKLLALVSRVIIELLVHNVTQDELDKALTKLGFGDRGKISKNWKEYELNLLTNMDAKWMDFSKPPQLKKSK
jgi:hypothetical protein